LAADPVIVSYCQALPDAMFKSLPGAKFSDMAGKAAIEYGFYHTAPYASMPVDATGTINATVIAMPWHVTR
jgi:hypothetical protein